MLILSIQFTCLLGLANIVFGARKRDQASDNIVVTASEALAINTAMVYDICMIYANIISAAALINSGPQFDILDCQVWNLFAPSSSAASSSLPSSSATTQPSTSANSSGTITSGTYSTTVSSSSASSTSNLAGPSKPSPVTCSSGSGISPGNTTCSVCVAGTYSSNNLCLPCGGSTYSSAGSSSCVPCLRSVGQAGITCDPKTGNALSVLAGYNFLAGQIVPCSPGTSSTGGLANISICSTCLAGTFAILSNSTSCSNCTTLIGQNGTSCDPQTGNPLLILPGYGYNDSGNLAACQAGTYSEGGDYAFNVVYGCGDCAFGFYTSSTASSSCIPCVGVDLSSDYSATCDAVTGYDLTCSPGLGLRVRSTTGSTMHCSLCQAGSYSTGNGICYKCPNGGTSTPGTTTSSKCTGGRQ